MKTFLKVVLLVLLALLALKVLPFALATGAVFVAVLLSLVALGLSVLGAIVGVGLVVAIVLSPLWLGLLALAALIGLIRRLATPRARAVA